MKATTMGSFKGRIVGTMFLACLSIPAFYYGRQYVTTHEVYAGDVVEERECRNCGGEGIDEYLDGPDPDGRCPFCAGTGQVKVIIPGPERPTRIHGSVVDEDAHQSGDRFDTPIPTNANLLLPLTGGVPGAVVRFTPSGGGETIQVKTNRNGRYIAKLPPAFYDVEVDAPGYGTYTDSLEVPQLTEEIWLEKAKLVEIPDTAAEQQAAYGIQFRVWVAR